MNIRELLEKIGEKPYYLVKALNTNYTVINKMLKNETVSISFETIDKLCEALGCDVQDLIKRDGLPDVTADSYEN